MATIIDDNENKGGKGKIRRQGRRATRKMNKEQKKDDLKYMPVDDHATPKQQSARKSKIAPVQRPPQPLVKRFVGSTPNIGKNNAMNAMVKGVVRSGLSAAAMNTVAKSVKAASEKTPYVASPPRDMAPSFKPSARTMELGEAHGKSSVGVPVTPKKGKKVTSKPAHKAKRKSIGKGPTPKSRGYEAAKQMIEASPTIHMKFGGGVKNPPVRTKKVKKVRTPRRYK